VSTDIKRTALTIGQPHSAEWGWVLRFSFVLMVLISIPLFWGIWKDWQSPDWAFMGFVQNPQDSATYIAKVEQGRQGSFSTTLLHSPNVTEKSYLALIYPILGHFSRYLGVSNTAIFHIARLIATLLMLLSLYELGAVVWQRQRTRRIFFILCVVASGFGWLALPLSGGTIDNTPDFVIPEAYPLLSAVTNVHFPLAMALLTLIVAQYIIVFSPGYTASPEFDNGGLRLILLTIFLAVLLPHMLVSITLAVLVLTAIRGVLARQFPLTQFRWALMLILPAIPIAVYYIAETRYNPIVSGWQAQNITLTPPIWIFLLGFGLPLIAALPAIWRAIRHFEPDGDQLMLLWLGAILLAVYLPTDYQRRFSAGAMIPIVYFVVRALDDFWVARTPARWRDLALVALYGFSGVTYLVFVALWFSGINSRQQYLFIPADYLPAFEWLAPRAQAARPVLASQPISLWIPAYSGANVVYGHPFETINAAENERLVEAWYAAETPNDPICSAVLEQFSVAYILVGPTELDGREAIPCALNLQPQEQFGDVVIYTP